MGGENTSEKQVIYNLDVSEFFINTFGPVAPETIDRWVDEEAAAGITDLFINVNAQKTNYRSDVWESYWDGYDPNAGDDQPFFDGITSEETTFYKNTYLLYKQGCDYPKRMIDRVRQNRMRPWISLRMNDNHFPECPNHPIHSTFWKSHPEWRLPYGMDYMQPEVREHNMKLLREVCARYDIEGIELDFLRFWLYFREGQEHEGKELITAFVKEARSVIQETEKHLGHRVKLAARVPSTPWIALRHGLDAVEWAKAGLVDLIIAGPFWPGLNSDIPIETWKGMLIGTDVKVAIGLEAFIDAGSGQRCSTSEEMRGVIASGLQRGADAVYFFNLFTAPFRNWPRKDHDQIQKDASSYEALAVGSRRHPLTRTRPWAVGELGTDSALPFRGKHGEFRIHIGPKPLPTHQVQVQMCVDMDRPMEVTCNGIPCSWVGSEVAEHLKSAGLEGTTELRQIYNIPMKAVSEGYNLIEVNAEWYARITWMEIAILED